VTPSFSTGTANSNAVAPPHHQTYTPSMDSEKWNRRYLEKDLLWSAEPNRFLVDEVANLPPGRALDLGAGEGRNAIWLAERGWRVTAVEFADAAVERGRCIAAERGVEVEWVCSDLLEWIPELSRQDRAAIAVSSSTEESKAV
jgi:2-polyprenyl-3-methyl-5-hydroxy-6-metoxy-1,4-benzoquinol methylase